VAASQGCSFPMRNGEQRASILQVLDDGRSGMEVSGDRPQSMTQREQLAIIGDVIGRPLRRKEMTRTKPVAS